MNTCTSIDPRSGLTLVELVVVLVILVLVAGAALTATGGLVDETRHERTLSELRSLESALLGHYDAASSGEPEAISFVADVGRLPRVASADPALALAELWEKPADVAAFGIQPAAGDPGVQLPAGWRGPYLRLGFGSARLVDGWSRAYTLHAADDAIAPLMTELRKVRTLGANDAIGGTGYDADATLVLESTAPTTVGARHLGAVPVRVRTTSAPGEFVYVRLYGARDGAVVTLAQFPPVGQADIAADGNDVVCAFTGIPVGPRAVRAYRTATPNSDVDAEFVAPTRSAVRAITVVQGGIAEVELTLP